MPKDKTLTHAKLMEAMKREFLEKGYENAAMNVIASAAGITPAGIYRHFRNKDEMFSALVEPVISELDRMCESDMQCMNQEDYDPFSVEVIIRWIDFFYDNFEEWKLLVCCSHGSAFQGFLNHMIQTEHESMLHFYPSLSGKKSRFIAGTFINALVLPIIEDMTKEEAKEHALFIRDFLYPGWKQLLT